MKTLVGFRQHTCRSLSNCRVALHLQGLARLPKQCMEFNPSWLESLLRCPCTQKATAFPWTLGILRSFSIPFPMHCSRTTVEFQMDEVTKFHFMIAGIPLSPLHNAISIGQEPSSCARQEIIWNWCQECYQSRLWRTLLKRSLERRFQYTFNPFSQRQAKGPEIVQWPKAHCQAFTLSFKSFFPAQMSLSVHWDDCNLWQFSVYVMRCLFHCYFDTRTKMNLIESMPAKSLTGDLFARPQCDGL